MPPDCFPARLADHEPSSAVVLLAAADPQVGTDVLSGYVSFFVDAARLPDQPGLGPVQEHRRKRAAYTMPLLRKRIEAETTDARF